MRPDEGDHHSHELLSTCSRPHPLFVDVAGKNGQDRGWVLRSADEIKLELEDNTLNLQSMAGSKFVVIFSDQVTSLPLTIQCSSPNQ